jgi:glycosyltransferase involved in cell wall biosynthesis
MKICYLYGGAQATDGGIGFLRNLCGQLREMGHNCSAILGDTENLLLKGSVEQEIHIRGDWEFGFGARARDKLSQLKLALNNLNPDLVHIIHPPGYYGIDGHIHAWPALWRRYPTVTTFWGLNAGFNSNWRARMSVVILAWFSDAVATHDYGILSRLSWICGGGRKIHYLPVGSNILPPMSIFEISQSELRRQLGLDPEAKYLGYFGGYAYGRGIDNLFQTLKMLKEKGYDRLKLLLIGWQRHLKDARFISIKQLMEREGIEDLVVLTPFAPAEEVARLLRAVNVCVFPFFRNAMGRSSLMAALSVGAPIVLTSILADLGPLNGAVLQVSPRDPEVLARGIQFLLDNPSDASKLGTAARRVWEENFSWPAIAEQHLTMYKTVSKKTRS